MDDLSKYIVEAVRKGDEEAFERVFHTYYNQLLIYACHYVIDREVARELIQDTFMILWENRSCLKNDTNLKAYLFTITRNNSLNYLKHLLVQKKHSETVRKRLVSYQLNYEALKDKTAEHVIVDELTTEVNRAIEKLPPRCREIFVLSRSSGLKHKEIANQLNISLKTVENQISEALKRIRTHLYEYLA